MKCEGCPVEGPACVAETPGWEFACKLKDGSASERRFLLAKSAMGVEPVVGPSPPPGAAAPVVQEPPWMEDAPPDPGEPSRRQVSLEEWTLVRERGWSRCWFSYKDASCGCTGLRCHLVGRIVGPSDCLECLKKAT